MEVTEQVDFKVLQGLLSPNEISEISNGVCQKLEGFFRDKFDEFITAKAVFETNRKNLDKKFNELTNNNQAQKEKLEQCQEKLDLAEKFGYELQSQLEVNRGELYRLQESIKRLEKENIELRKQKNDFIDENNTLHSQVERKDSEFERLSAEFASLGLQLQAAIASKCEALSEIEEVRSREMTLDFKEKRLEQERALLSQQMVGLEEELSKRTNELQNTRSEASVRALLTHTRLSQCEEELKITNESMIQVRETNSMLQRRCEELTQKMDDQRNHELIMHASYKEEVTAQIRLADLYKGMADEANAKADDYSNAVKELQDLLEHATEQYGILESKHNQIIINNDHAIIDKQKEIDELTKELNLANELLKTIKQERLDQAVEQLAPTAAIASRILKKGLSLTQIYTQLVEATNELSLEREENEKLKSQMEIILRELEEKAPILQQQREDYEAAIANVTTLSLRLDELLTENNNLQEDTDESKRLANHQNKENQRLKSELADLARQVCYLLKEVQESRSGNTITIEEHNPLVTDDLASSQIISKKLVTFKDIEGLQENNQKLLSIVRTLSSRQEEIEKATDQINSGEMKEKLDRYIEQLTEMQSAQDRQTKMVEGLLKQRDMYKRMYTQCISQTSNTKDLDKTEYIRHEEQNVQANEMVTNQSNEYKLDDDEVKKLHKKLQDSETRFNQVNDDFNIYRKEKVVHEQMLNEEIERLRKDTEKNSARCCRLKAQLDSANERFSLLQGNVASYKSQIKILEEKCNNYSITIGKHEQSLMILKDETLTAQSSLSKAEVQLENLKQEKQLLRDSEGRLLKEREVLQRERHTNAVLKADIEAIKTSLDRDRAEAQFRTEQRLDDASRECAALRRRLQEEQDRFRELSLHLERQVSTAQDRLREEKNLTERIQVELNASRITEQEYRQRIDELNSKLKQSSANMISKSITGDENLSKRFKDLEVQFASSQAEVKCLSDQLKTARFQSQQYCDIAESSESQLREVTDQFGKSKEELENNLRIAQNKVLTLQDRVTELEDKLLKVSKGQHSNDSEIREKLAQAERNIEELNELKGELELLKNDLQNSSVATSVAEDKYAREMILHTADLQLLSKLKEENQAVSEKVSKLILQRNSAKDALAVEKSTSLEREKRLNDEIKNLQNRLVDLDAQNIILHNQIQELSEKAAIMQSQKQMSPNTSFESMNRSFSEEDSKSTESLLQVMKYLRREKDLTIAKFDVLKSENMRLKSQTELAEKRVEEIKKLLECERENNEIHVVTASKHSELLRKVETLNAITDSNRILREERDSLSYKIKDLTSKLSLLSEEVIPLREKYRDLEAKYESLLQENSSLKGEAMRWRQRANTLVERANKASPDDWRRLQTERENLSKLLTSERETHAKQMEELNSLKHEKSKSEEQLSQVQRQLQSQEEHLAKMANDIRKLNQDLNDTNSDLTEKLKDIANLKKELTEKDVILIDLKNKEIQIRRIAKKYKTQYEELTKSVEEEKSRLENSQTCQASISKMNEDDLQVTLERDTQLREEGRSELRQSNDQLNLKVDELKQQMLVMQSESENLKKEIEIINKVSLEKEERAKQVLKGARTKIMQLTEYKKLCEKEVHELKQKLNSSTSECESNVNEYEVRLTTLKSQMEARILRLEHERSDLQVEKEALFQRAAQLQRQLIGQSNLGTGTSEPPTANIKPMSARTETPLASIRPMSVVVQSRTAAVLPTTAGAPLLLASQQSQQQIVHTTETSSPTSSHMDYQPASTSRQLLVQPQLNESAESTQREEPEIVDPLSTQQQQQQQCQQQAVALVSPRVEQQQQQQQQQQQSLPSDQQQTVPSSSTQSVSTSHTSVCHKRPRTLDSSASGSNLNENIDHTRQEQISSPKSKRSRQQDLTSTPASASEIEYQVPTSSQRDQDEEGDDGCVVVVDCDESGTHPPQEEEEFDNDPYEEIEEEEEIPYSVGVERDNNEVEIIMEEDSTSVEIPRQIQAGTPSNQQQQSEAISSAGPTGEPPSFASRSSRGIAPMPRQQPQQQLLLPQQGYEDGGDDCIVPSTPTLFVPRRNDGFGEAVSSPQVPQGRFTFGEPSASVSVSTAQSHTNQTNCGTRTIFGSTGSGLAQVVREGMDDTRVDLTQLEDSDTGRIVPTTPQQVSPTIEQPGVVLNRPIDEHDGSVPASESQIHTAEGSDGTIIPVMRTCINEQEEDEREIIIHSDLTNDTDGNIMDSNKRLEETGTSRSVGGEEDVIDTDVEGSEEVSEEIVDNDSKEENREAEASPSSNTRQRAMAAAAAAASSLMCTMRGATARRSARTTFRTTRGTRPTPIVWDNQSSRGQNVVRGHAIRGPSSESSRVRGARGRRMRSKYPYNY